MPEMAWSHTFEMALFKASEKKKIFDRRSNAIELAEKRAARIREIVRRTAQAIRRFSRAQATPEEIKERGVQYALDLVQRDADKGRNLIPPGTKGETFSDFSMKLHQGITAVRQFDEHALDILKLQLIGPYFSNEIRKRVKRAVTRLAEGDIVPGGLSEHALGLAQVHTSGSQDWVKGYMKSGRFARTHPDMKDQLSGDWIRAFEIRQLNTRRVKDAIKKVQELHRENRGLRPEIEKNYPEILHAMSQLFHHSPNSDHAGMLVDYQFGKERKLTHQLRAIRQFAHCLQTESGGVPVRAMQAMDLIARLWNRSETRWLVPQNANNLVPAIRELIRLYREVPTRMPGAVEEIINKSWRKDNLGKELGTDFVTHVRTFAYLLEINNGHFERTRTEFEEEYLQREGSKRVKAKRAGPKVTRRANERRREILGEKNAKEALRKEKRELQKQLEDKSTPAGRIIQIRRRMREISSTLG